MEYKVKVREGYTIEYLVEYEGTSKKWEDIFGEGEVVQILKTDIDNVVDAILSVEEITSCKKKHREL